MTFIAESQNINGRSAYKVDILVPSEREYEAFNDNAPVTCDITGKKLPPIPSIIFEAYPTRSNLELRLFLSYKGLEKTIRMIKNKQKISTVGNDYELETVLKNLNNLEVVHELEAARDILDELDYKSISYNVGVVQKPEHLEECDNGILKSSYSCHKRKCFSSNHDEKEDCGEYNIFIRDGLNPLHICFNELLDSSMCGRVPKENRNKARKNIRFAKDNYDEISKFVVSKGI